jgi:hypothetical protein
MLSRNNVLAEQNKKEQGQLYQITYIHLQA